MRMLLAAAVLAATAFAVRAQAQDQSTAETNRQDVRCVIGMSVMGRNEQYKSWGLTGVLYYAGRIEGRSAGYDLADAIKREVRQIPPADYNDLVRGCSDRLGEKSRALEALKPPTPRGVGR